MKELIFCIEDIFNDMSTSGCLSQYEVSCYHIPAYQRGYKWGVGKGEPVTVLLEDLWAAYEKKEAEYYLQYITVKRQPLELNNNSTYCLEVIDGQQRITTLSILLSTLVALYPEDNYPEKNITEHKLHYAIRENFFSEFIYEQNKLLSLVQTDWGDFIDNDSERLDRQDVFYLHGAACECFQFMDSKKKDVKGFHKYICSAVKIIVNSIEPHIESEVVFKNLNSNRVPLTTTELIKGLLITRVGRHRVEHDDSSFREVMEVRLSLGKEWENIQRWSQNPSIRNFYFDGGNDSLYELLLLLALKLGAKIPKTKLRVGASNFPLFDYYNQFSDLSHAFKELISVQQILADWFETEEIYHLIGFCRFANSSSHNDLSFLLICLQKRTKQELINWLSEKKRQLIYGDMIKGQQQSISIESLHYGEDNQQIHAVLLALSVFPQAKLHNRFDFDAFKGKNWSLEHIFPQTPEGKGHVLNDAQKENIRNMLGDSLSEDVERVLELDSRTEDQRLLYEEALRDVGALDNIGNMCLLTCKDNSVLGNSFFDDKRKKVLSLIQQGAFVPMHTFDVFAKMIKGLDGNIEQWSTEDIKIHAAHISKHFDDSYTGDADESR